MLRFLIALLFPTMVCAETVIVQSWPVTEIYGQSITREYVGLTGEPVTSIYLKQFKQEAYGSRVEASREITSRFPLDRNKVITIGRADRVDAQVSLLNSDIEGEWCDLDPLFLMLAHARHIPSFYTILADKSDIGSQLATCWSAQLRDRKIKARIIHFDTVLELRKYLRNIETKTNGMLFNAMVSLRNDDTLQDYDAERIALELRRWNSDHLDVGPMKHKDFSVSEAITIGVLPKTIAHHIVLGEPLRSSVFVNQERLDDLNMRAIYISNIGKIDGIAEDDE